MFEKICNLLRRIENNGYQAYIVGGYVRDFYMNKNNNDIDICTSATPTDLKRIFPNIVLNNYGSLILTEDGIKYEITTFRKETKYVDNRYPEKIKYVKRLKTDIKRRDFTMNAICLNSNGNYIDYFNGKRDIDNKIIKAVGNPNKKIIEDVLRILRAVRFSTMFNFEIDEKLKLAIKKYGYLLSNLSYFRKKEEIEKIFLSGNIQRGINILKELNLDKALELQNLDKLVITSSLIGIWAQLGVYDVYEFTNNEKKVMMKISNLLPEDKIIDKNILYNYGLDICLIVAEIKKLDKDKITQMYNNLVIKSYKDINISSDELINIIRKKDLISTIYKDIEGLIINSKLKNEKQAIIDYVVKRYN